MTRGNKSGILNKEEEIVINTSRPNVTPHLGTAFSAAHNRQRTDCEGEDDHLH